MKRDEARDRTRRSRPMVALLGITIVAIGLSSRRYGAHLPEGVRLYAGDALWAAGVFLLAALLWPRARTAHLALGALAFAFAIEASQLYHAPWIDVVRATRPGSAGAGPRLPLVGPRLLHRRRGGRGTRGLPGVAVAARRRHPVRS